MLVTQIYIMLPYRAQVNNSQPFIMDLMSKKLSAFVILAALLGFGVFSLFGSHHMAFSQHQECAQVLGSADCATSAQDPSNTCAEFTLTVLKKFSQSLPLAQKSFLAVLGAVLLLILVTPIQGWLENYRKFILTRRRLRLASNNFILRFFKQLGNWLSLLEKNMPALAFSMAQGRT